MMSKILKYAKRPEIYEQSSTKFWDDQHISSEMLRYHLHPTADAASRNHDFIDRSVEWIKTIAPTNTNKSVLDLGCGPGLYTERLFKKGYRVTGVDFSKRSIEYAKDQAKIQGHSIEYTYMDYLKIDYSGVFDLILLIFCDFGVLSHEQREILLKKVYSAMKSGGKFIFDVFTPKNYEGKEEENNWYLQQQGGFWKPEAYLCLESHYIYEDNIRLDQHIIISEEDNVDVFRVWDRCYTREMIKKELEQIGFRNIKVYSDVTGKDYDEESKTMCIVAEK